MGLIEFSDDGTVRRINPAATAMLPADSTTMLPILSQVAGLVDKIRTAPATAGPLIENHPLRFSAPGSPILALTVVRTNVDQLMAVIADATVLTARADEHLRASEARFRSVFDSIDEGFCLCEMVLDANGTPIDYRFVEINPMFEEMSGLVDALGKTALELVPDLERIWIDTYAKVALGGETLRFEQGSEAMGRWFDVFSMPVDSPGRFAVVFKDRTQQHRAQLDLKAAARADAFRARLADGLRLATEPLMAQEIAARLLGEFLGADRVHYVDIEPDGEYGVVAVDYGVGMASVVGRHRLDDYGPTVMAQVRAGFTVIIEDASQDPRLSPAQRLATARLGVGAYVMAPLQRNNRTVAAIAIHHQDVYRWSDDELTIITDCLDRTWTAVVRVGAEATARENEALERRGRERAEFLAELLSELEGVDGVVARAQRLVERMVPRIADYATVESPEAAKPLLASTHIDPARLEALRELRERHRLPGSHPMSHITVPLDLGGARGVLLAGLTRGDRAPYTAEDLGFLTQIGERAGILLASAHLREEEREVSLRLQRALLPDALVQHPWVDIDACYLAADRALAVGGDWYDSFLWPEGHVGVCVGDVVGHGIESAASMGRLRSAASALAAHIEPSPAALLNALDRFAQGADGTSFATACCAVVEVATGVLRYSSAGHPPILLVAPSGQTSFLSDAQSPPLCAGGAGCFDATVVLEPGSLVVLYSDGLIERRGECIDLGLTRLAEAAAGLATSPMANLADRLVARLSAHSTPEDDIAVACFRYLPALARLELHLPARAEQLAGLRTQLRAWLASQHLADAEGHDLVVVVSEACSNAMEHAYHDGEAGHVDVVLTNHSPHVLAVITDHGNWRPEHVHDTDGGRGTLLMRALSASFSCDVGLDGTTVTMRLPMITTITTIT